MANFNNIRVSIAIDMANLEELTEAETNILKFKLLQKIFPLEVADEETVHIPDSEILHVEALAVDMHLEAAYLGVLPNTKAVDNLFSNSIVSPKADTKEKDAKEKYNSWFSKQVENYKTAKKPDVSIFSILNDTVQPVKVTAVSSKEIPTGAKDNKGKIKLVNGKPETKVVYAVTSEYDILVNGLREKLNGLKTKTALQGAGWQVSEVEATERPYLSCKAGGAWPCIDLQYLGELIAPHPGTEDLPDGLPFIPPLGIGYEKEATWSAGAVQIFEELRSYTENMGVVFIPDLTSNDDALTGKVKRKDYRKHVYYEDNHGEGFALIDPFTKSIPGLSPHKAWTVLQPTGNAESTVLVDKPAYTLSQGGTHGPHHIKPLVPFSDPNWANTDTSTPFRLKHLTFVEVVERNVGPSGKWHKVRGLLNEWFYKADPDDINTPDALLAPDPKRDLWLEKGAVIQNAASNAAGKDSLGLPSSRSPINNTDLVFEGYVMASLIKDVSSRRQPPYITYDSLDQMRDTEEVLGEAHPPSSWWLRYSWEPWLSRFKENEKLWQSEYKITVWSTVPVPSTVFGMKALSKSEQQSLASLGVDMDDEANFKKFLQNIKSLGVRMLLTYYDKQRSTKMIDNLLSYGDSIIKVEDWRYSWPTDPDKNNPAAKDYIFRAVVTIPARIFDAIPKSTYTVQMIGQTQSKMKTVKKPPSKEAAAKAPTPPTKLPDDAGQGDTATFTPAMKAGISAAVFLSRYVAYLGARILEGDDANSFGFNFHQKDLPEAYKGSGRIRISWLGIKYQKAAVLKRHKEGQGYKPYGPNKYTFATEEKIDNALKQFGMTFEKYLDVHEKDAKAHHVSKLKQEKAAARNKVNKRQDDQAKKELARLFGETVGQYDTGTVLEKIQLPTEAKDLKASFSHTTTLDRKKPTKGHLKKDIKYTVSKIFRHYQKKLDKLKNKKGLKLDWVTPGLGSDGLAGPLLLFGKDNDVDYAEGDILNNYHDMLLNFLKLNRVDYLRDRNIMTGGDSPPIYVGDPGDPTTKDMVELGWDEDFNLVFVLFNGTPLTIGFGALVAATLQLNPSGVPMARTNAFIARHEYMRKNYKKGKKRLSVHKWCAQFVYPPGELQITGHKPQPEKAIDAPKKADETPTSVKKKTQELEKKKVKINQEAKKHFKELKSLQDFMNDATQIINNVEDAYSKIISKYGIQALLIEAIRCHAGELVSDPEEFIVEWILEQFIGEAGLENVKDQLEQIEEVLEYLPIDCIKGLLGDLVQLKAIEKKDPAEIKKEQEEKKKAKEKAEKEYKELLKKALEKNPEDVDDLPDFGLPYWREVTHKTANYEAFDETDPQNIGVEKQYEVLNLRSGPSGKDQILAELKEGTLLKHHPWISTNNGMKKGYKGNWIYVTILGGPGSIHTPDKEGIIQPGRNNVPADAPAGTEGELLDPEENKWAEQSKAGWVHKKYTASFTNPYGETKIVLKKGKKDFAGDLKDEVSIWIKYLISERSAQNYLAPGVPNTTIRKVAWKGVSAGKIPKDPFDKKIQQSQFTGKIETATYKLLGVKHVTNFELQKAIAFVKGQNAGSMLLSEMEDKWRFPTPYIELGGVAIAPPGFWTKTDKQRKRPKKHRRCDDLYTQLLKEPDNVAKKAAYYGCMQKSGILVYGEGKSFYAAKIGSTEEQAEVSAHVLAASKGKCSEFQENLRKVLQKRKKTDNGKTTGEPLWPGASAEPDELALYNKWTACIKTSAVEEQEKWVAREHDLGNYPTNLDELVAFYKKHSELPFNAEVKATSDADFGKVVRTIFKYCGQDMERLLRSVVDTAQEKAEDDPTKKASLDVAMGILAGVVGIGAVAAPAIEAFKTPQWPTLETSDPDGRIMPVVTNILEKMIDELILHFVKSLLDDLRNCPKPDELPVGSGAQEGGGGSGQEHAEALNDLAAKYGLNIPPIIDPSSQFSPTAPGESPKPIGTFDEASEVPGTIVNLSDLIDTIKAPPPEGIGVSKFCNLINGNISTGLFTETHSYIRNTYPLVSSELSDPASMKRFFVDIGNILDKEFCFPKTSKGFDEPCDNSVPTGFNAATPTLPYQLGPKSITKEVEKRRLITLANWVDNPQEMMEKAVDDPCASLPGIRAISPSFGDTTDSVLNTAFDALSVIFTDELGLFVPMLTLANANLPDAELVNSLIVGENDAMKLMEQAVNPSNIEQTELGSFAKQMEKDMDPASQRVVVNSQKDVSPSTKQLFVCSADLSNIIIRTHEKGSGPNKELLKFKEAVAAGIDRFDYLPAQMGNGYGHNKVWKICREKTFDETVSEMKKRAKTLDGRQVAPYLRKVLRNPLNFIRTVNTTSDHTNLHRFKLPPDRFSGRPGPKGYAPGFIDYKTVESAIIADTYEVNISKFDVKDDSARKLTGRYNLPDEIATYIQKNNIDYPNESEGFDTPQSVVCTDFAMKLIRASFGNTGISLTENSPVVLTLRKNLQPVVAQSIFEGIMDSTLKSRLFQYSEIKKLNFRSTISDIFDTCQTGQRSKTTPSESLLGISELKGKIKENYLDNLEWCTGPARRSPDSDQTITGNIMKALVPLFLRVTTIEAMLNNIFLFSQHSLKSCFNDEVFKDFLFEKVKFDLRKLYLYKAFRTKATQLVQDEEEASTTAGHGAVQDAKSKKRAKSATGDEALRYLFEQQFEDLSGVFERMLGTTIKDEKAFIFESLIKGFKQVSGRNSLRLVDAQGADEIIDIDAGTWASGKSLDSAGTTKRFEVLPGVTKTKSSKNKHLPSELERGGFILERYIFVEDKLLEDGTPVIDATLSLFNLPKRPDWAKGYVNINDWETWLASLREGMTSNLGTPLFDSIKNAFSKSFSEYFKQLGFGLRLTYVLANTNISDEAMHRGLKGGRFAANMTKKLKNDLGAKKAAEVFVDNQDGFVTELTEAVDSLVNFKPDFPTPQAIETLGGLRTYKTLFPKLNTLAKNPDELSQLFIAAWLGGANDDEKSKAYRMIPLFEKNLSILDRTTRREHEPADVPSSIFDWGQATFHNKKYSPHGDKHRGHTHYCFARDMGSLKRSIAESPEFKTLFNFVFPIKRYLSMASIYNITALRRLQRNKDLLQGTKIAIKDLYFMSARGASWDTSGPNASDETEEDTALAEAHGLSVETDSNAFSSLLLKILIQCPLEILKGVVEASDPNIQVSKKIFDGINMAMALIYGQQEGEDADPCEDGNQTPQLPGYVHPIISLLLFPSMAYGVGFPPPWGFGPPLTPMGAAYLALQLTNDLWDAELTPPCDIPAKDEVENEDCADEISGEVKKVLKKEFKKLSAKETKKKKPDIETDPNA